MINSLQGVLNSMVQQSLQASGGTSNLARQVTYQTFQEPTYDPQTGDVFPTFPVSYSISGVLVGYTAREVLPDVVLMTDQKILILKIDLPVTPQTRDAVLIPDSNNNAILWRVVMVQDDAANVVWVLQIRRASSEGAV